MRRLVRNKSDQDSFDGCSVFPMLDVFYFIYESYSIKLGHVGDERTYTDVTINTTLTVKQWFEYSLGAVFRAIRNSCYPSHQRSKNKSYQINILIDFRLTVLIWDRRKRILTCPGYTYIISWPHKEAKCVTHELDHFLDLIGCQTFFDTLNEKDF